MRVEGQEPNLLDGHSIPLIVPNNRQMFGSGTEEAIMPDALKSRSPPVQLSRKVFLVHGRDEAAKTSVENYLRMLGLEPIVLHQRPNRGRHLLTKFTEEASGASFAVVLMTPDDEGGLPGQSVSRRARQNVVFELGFFIGVLKTTHVAALLAPEVEKPSDFEGIAYLPFDQTGQWKSLLAREMREAGVPFEAHLALGA